MPFRRMQELQSQDFTSNCLLYVCGREFCAAGLSIHRTRETRHRRPWPAERALARTSSRFTYGSTWYVSSFNMTRILPPYFWIFWSSASSVSSPNQSLNSDHSMPNWIMPKHPSSGIRVESSCFRCIRFRCQSCLPNWKFTNKQWQSGCFILWKPMGRSLHATHLKLRIQISNFSVFVVAGASYWAHPSYPLVNCHVTMENHHSQCVNPLFLWPFSIAM